MHLYLREPRTSQTGPPTRPGAGRADVPPRGLSVILQAWGSEQPVRCRTRRVRRAGRPGAGRGVAARLPGRDPDAQIGLRTSTPTSSGGPDTTTGSSRQPRHHHAHPKPRPQNRLSPTDAPTRHAPTTAFPAPPAYLPRRLEQLTPLALTPHRRLPDLLTPIPAAAPPLATQASRLGWPVQVLPGRSRKGSPADSPSSESPGGKPRKHPKAGRRPVALRGETHRAKQMEGNKWRATDVLCALPAHRALRRRATPCRGAPRGRAAGEEHRERARQFAASGGPAALS
jgi:hypothetical protein